MGQRSDALASQFEKAFDDIIAEVEEASDSKWQAVCGPEAWTVAATAHHVAVQLPLEKEYIVAAAEGAPPPTYTWDEINSLNESRAAEHSAVSKADVLQYLRDGRVSMGSYVRGLSDEQLDSKAPLGLANGAEVSAEQLLLGGVLIEHATTHLASIRAAG
jgi:hypothetical protein